MASYKEEQVRSFYKVVGALNVILQNIEEIEKHPLFKHSFKQSAKLFIEKAMAIEDKILADTTDESNIEVIKQYFEIAKVIDSFIGQLFDVSRSLSESEAVQLKTEIDELFNKYLNK